MMPRSITGLALTAAIGVGAYLHQDVGRELAPPRSRATDASSEAARVERAVSPRGRDPRAVSELAAVSGEQQSGSNRTASRAAVETRAATLLALGAPAVDLPDQRSRGVSTREGEGARVDGSSNAQRAQKTSTGESRARINPASLSPRLIAADRPAGSRITRPRGAAEPAGSTLVAAQMAWLEGGPSITDAAALVYAIKRRAARSGRDFVSMAYAYSQLDSNTPNARRARQLPDGDSPALSARENERWAAVRKTAAEALAGTAPNPCPRADGWGGVGDAVRARQIVVRCRRRTANWFYRVQYAEDSP